MITIFAHEYVAEISQQNQGVSKYKNTVLLV